MEKIIDKMQINMRKNYMKAVLLIQKRWRKKQWNRQREKLEAIEKLLKSQEKEDVVVNLDQNLTDMKNEIDELYERRVM